MKKLILSIVCLILMGVLSIQAQTAKIILQHGDEAKIFASYQLQNAINEAVDNDVIYLNEGTFHSTSNEDGYYGDSGTNYYLRLNKSISFIGAGFDKTYLFNFVELSDDISVSFEGMKIAGLGLYFRTLNQKRVIKDVKANKCIINWLFFSRYYHTDISWPDIQNMQFESCDIGKVYFGNTFLKGLITNCKIGVFDADRNWCNLLLKNCNIKSFKNLYGEEISLENCIFSKTENSSIYASNIINTLYYRETDFSFNCSNVKNIWLTVNALFDINGECTMSDEELKNAGYLGTDGTVIGINGGATPFDLTSSRPNVSEYKIDIDPQTRKMTINLKVNSK